MPMSNNVRMFGLAVLILLAAALRAHAARADETLIVAGGCFWCVEADFEHVPGVTDAQSGFTGGHVTNPTYRQVTSGGTGHFEAVRITFDPARVSRKHLLTLFLRSIDPTDAGGQFCDRGTTYRTAIFVSNKSEKALAEQIIATAQAELGQPVVTQILRAGPFYPADAYHQDYYKSSDRIITRYGIRTKAKAYKLYRKACGRDARVRQLWGDAAPFARG